MPSVCKSWLLVGGVLGSLALSGCVSQNDYNALMAQNTRLRQQNAEAESALAASNVKITRLQGAIKYTINSDLLFAPGSWEMSDAGKQAISKMAPKLAPSPQQALVVNGYTDDVPIGQGLERKGVSSNNELSQKRAQAVKDYMVSQGVDPNLIQVRGHGASNPVAANDTAKGRSQNRRVELTLGG